MVSFVPSPQFTVKLYVPPIISGKLILSLFVPNEVFQMDINEPGLFDIRSAFNVELGL